MRVHIRAAVTYFSRTGSRREDRNWERQGFHTQATFDNKYSEFIWYTCTGREFVGNIFFSCEINTSISQSFPEKEETLVSSKTLK